MCATFEAKRRQRERLLLPKPNSQLQCSKRLATTTYNSSKFWESFKVAMDNEMFVETKTNDNDYILGESIIYSLELNDV
jgi:hypothetical protein